MADEESERGKTWAAFEMADVEAERKQAGCSYLEFLRASTLFAGLYALRADAEDRQGVHKEDEVYYILGGRAVMRIGEEEHAVQAGSVIYVKAGTPHRFHSIKEELSMFVFFSTAARDDGPETAQ